MVVLAPLLLLVVGTIQLHKLKSAVRHLVRRVADLESRGVTAVPAAPVAETAAASVIAPAPVPPPVPFASPPAPGPSAFPPSASQPPPPLPPRVPQAPPPPPAPPLEPFDWEAFFGVKLFAWIGGFVLFLGIVFLVKYSFENNLITPAMRVAIGTVLGLLLIGTGWFTASRNYRVSGQSLCATGVLVLYGNIFAAHVFYHLIDLVPAFASMAIVTAAAFFLALRLNAQVIVIFGLLGGFLTPVLLSTGVDNPAALFGYIALLNVGIAAVAVRKRWDYLVLLSAAGTILMEFAWADKFFVPSKANIAYAVFLGFEAQFLAIFALARRRQAAAAWTARSAIALALAALAWGFCLLSYPEFGPRPGFLFTYIFLAEAGLLGLALLARTGALVPVSGGIVFVFLAIWTGNYLTDALLWPALAGYVVFSILHAGFAVWPQAMAPEAPRPAWQTYVPLLPLALIWICVSKNETSSAVWLCLLILNFVCISVALLRRSLIALSAAIVLTFF
ncbi:MAG TPA: DUF2339 domain-containing protein, partial [Chthoniobacterales bacterium]|nr:DUF2339 domain-containing protein [Chthoniobacterales bacterium]